MPANYFIKEGDKSNSIYSYYYPRLKTENRSEIGTKSSKSIYLTDLISPTKPLYH